MKIEEEIFKKSKPNYDKLIEYGFKKENNKYIYKEKFKDEEFEAIITIDKTIKGQVIDINTKEEYINIRIENTGTYTNKIKEEYKKILKKIKENCFESEYFMSPQANRITKYIIEKYKVEPEFLWKKLDGSAVFRNKKNKKWFGIIMDINKNKLEKENKIIEIINTKINETEKEQLLKNKGIYEAYHMNKKNWITMTLDDTLKDTTIINQIEKSYNIINK